MVTDRPRARKPSSFHLRLRRNRAEQAVLRQLDGEARRALWARLIGDEPSHDLRTCFCPTCTKLRGALRERGLPVEGRA